jgi:hypothetical protein
MKKIAGPEDAFFIEMLDKDSLKDILFVHTSVGILKKNIPYLCMGEEIPKERFNEMDAIMNGLDAFAQCQENSGANAGGGESGEGGEENAGASGGSDFDMNTLRDKIVKR